MSVMVMYAGARYGVLTVRFVPPKHVFEQKAMAPQARVFCADCGKKHWVTERTLRRGRCPEVEATN